MSGFGGKRSIGEPRAHCKTLLFRLGEGWGDGLRRGVHRSPNLSPRRERSWETGSGSAAKSDAWGFTAPVDFGTWVLLRMGAKGNGNARFFRERQRATVS